jgi:hypothetical protein
MYVNRNLTDALDVPVGSTRFSAILDLWIIAGVKRTIIEPGGAFDDNDDGNGAVSTSVLGCMALKGFEPS